MTGARLAIVVKGFPRLSETFVARELAALEARGISFELHALRAPGSDARLVAHEVKAQPRYLPEYLHDAPLTVLRAILAARRLPGFAHALRQFRLDAGRDFSRARFRRFGQACVLATRLAPGVRHVHAHFAHSPGSVARYAATMIGARFSLSAHAKDIWTTPGWDLNDKLRGAAFVLVCNKAGHEELRRIGPSDRLHLIHHGVASTLFANSAVPQHRDGRDPAAPLRIVCVARAVEKKGLRLLLEALSRLVPSFSFELDHYGGGELLPSLKVEASRLGFDGRVRWHGAVAHQQVIAALDGADLFVLPLSVATDGDRDGIPNAVLEAQARGVCVLTTVAGSIDEAIVDGETGRIVQGAEGLALAIEELGRAPADRERLASNALRARRDTFNAEAGYDAIARLLRAQMDVQ